MPGETNGFNRGTRAAGTECCYCAKCATELPHTLSPSWLRMGPQSCLPTVRKGQADCMPAGSCLHLWCAVAARGRGGGGR